MASKMKSFRASEDCQYMLERYSEYAGMSQSHLIETALDWFAASGALAAIADLKHKDEYKTYPDFRYKAVHDGDIRVIVRRNNGLGIAPVTSL